MREPHSHAPAVVQWRSARADARVVVNFATRYSAAANADAPLLLDLYAGLNIVELEVHNAVDAPVLAVDGALALPSAGAQLPFVQLEAENASTSGEIIGPSFAFTTLPSEASARMAVQLAPGQYVDFVVPPGAAASAVMMRFSVPDAPAGNGIDTPALVFVDGALVGNITLTSHYAWLYGSYPFTKNPGDGKPHHFYDEYWMWLPQRYTAGSTIRVQNPSAGSTRRLQAPSCSYQPPDPSKRDCGYYGVNETTCLARNCCWTPITPNPNNYPWCFFPQAPPPPPPEPGNVTITVDLLDLWDVAAPVPPPPNAVSIVDHGADPTGQNDSSTAVQAAIAAAVSAGAPVWVPNGTFAVTAHISLPSNVTIVGAGPWYSAFSGAGVGLYGNPSPASTNVRVSGLSLVGRTNVRIDSEADTGIGGALTDSIVANVFITHTKCGCWLDGPFDSLLLSGLVIRDTMADGVNFHRGISNSVVEHTALRNTGDDCLAMWSDAQADVNNTFRFNTAQLPVLANNFAVYGGSGNAVLSSVAADSVTQGGGLHVGNRFSSVPLAGVTTLDGNIVVRGGQLDPNWDFGTGALWMYALDEAMTGVVNVTNTAIVDSPYPAIMFIGSSITNVNFRNVSVTNVGTFVWQLQSAGSAVVQDVVAAGTQYFGVYDCGAGMKLTDAGGNAGWNTSHCGFPPSTRS